MSLYDHFNKLLELNSDEQEAYLTSLTTQDLKAELVRLLQQHDQLNVATDWHDLVAQQVRTVTGDEQLNRMIGKQIGPYKLVEELGRGGMSVVYRADRIDGALKQNVAIKFLMPSVMRLVGESVVHREAQILVNLNHPNITKVFDAGTTESGLNYFIMEVLDAVPIDIYCTEHNLSDSDIINLFLDLADAIKSAHLLNIVHTDIKPSNIMVTNDGIVKVLDFGIAKLVHGESATIEHQTLKQYLQAMSLPYAAPEQLQQSGISKKTDQYALSVLLYELLTKSLPFDVKNKTKLEVIEKKCEETWSLESPKRGVFGISTINNDLLYIINKALQTNPRSRYESVQAMQSELFRYQKHLPLADKSHSLIYRLRKWLRRSPAQATIFSLLVVFLATFYTQNQRINLEKETAEQVAEQLAGIFKMTDPTLGFQPNLSGRDILLKGATNITNDNSLSLLVKSQLLITITESLLGLGYAKDALSVISVIASNNQLKSDSFDLYFRANRLAISCYQSEGATRKADRMAKKLFTEMAQHKIPLSEKYKAYKQFLSAGITNITGQSLEYFEGVMTDFKVRADTLSDEEYWSAQYAQYAGYKESVDFAYFYGEITQSEYEAKRNELKEQFSLILAGMPQTHLNYSDVMVLKAAWLAETGETCGCSNIIQNKIDAYKKRFGPHHKYVRGLYYDLARISEYERKYVKALEYFKQFMRLKKEQFGEASTEYLASIPQLTNYYIQIGDVKTAEQIFLYSHQLFNQLDTDEKPLEVNVGYYYGLNAGIGFLEMTDQFHKAYPYILEINKLIENDPVFTATNDFLAEVTLNRARKNYITEGPNAAIAYLTSQKEHFVFPNDFEWNFEMARQQYFSGNYQQAVDYYEKAIPVVTKHLSNIPSFYNQNIGIQYVKALASAGYKQRAQSELESIYAFNYAANPSPNNYWLTLLKKMAFEHELELINY